MVELTCSVLSRKTDSTKHLGKRIILDQQGKIVSDSSHARNVGDYLQTVKVLLDGRSEFTTLTNILRYCETGAGYLCQGVPKSSTDRNSINQIPLQTQAQYQRSPPPPGVSIARRDKDYLAIPDTASLLLIDSDHCISRSELLKALHKIIQIFPKLGYVMRRSSSTGIYHQGKYLKSPHKGWHTYLIIDKGQHHKEVLEALYVIMWAMGYGWILVSRAGHGLERSLLDQALRGPAQPIYEAYSSYYLTRSESLFTQYEGKRWGLSGTYPVQPTRDIYTQPGQALDTEAFLNWYRSKETTFKLQYQRNLAKALALADSEIQKQRRLHGKRVKSHFAAADLKTPKNLKRILDMAQQGILSSSALIRVRENSWIPAKDILLNPDKYESVSCYDPIEPTTYGHLGTAKIYANQLDESRNAKVNSFAHGEFSYEIQWDQESILALLQDGGEAADIPNQWKKILYYSNIKPNTTEWEAVIRPLARLLGVPKTSLNSDYHVYRGSRQPTSIQGSPAALEKRTWGRLESQKSKLTPAGWPVDYLTRPINDQKYDLSLRIPASKFPDLKDSDEAITCHDVRRTLVNLKFLMDSYGMQIRYNEVSRNEEISLPEGAFQHFTGDATDISYDLLGDQIQRCDLPFKPHDVTKMVYTISRSNSIDPIVEYLEGLVWDGKDRLPEFFDTLRVAPEHVVFRNRYMTMWGIQACAAADRARIARRLSTATRCQYDQVLALQGGQGPGKSAWPYSLAPKPLKQYVKGGQSLNLRDKDDRVKATGAWYAEMAELDGTFKKSDIADIKAFLSQREDEFRVPYAKKHEIHDRRSCYFASVNEQFSLRDPTGNRRIMMLQILEAIEPHLVMDVDQLWAQLWHLYCQGVRWWMTPAEVKELAKANEAFEYRNGYELEIEGWIAEVYGDLMAPEVKAKSWGKEDYFLTSKRILERMASERDLSQPESRQKYAKALNEVLKRLSPGKCMGVDKKRVSGNAYVYRWPAPVHIKKLKGKQSSKLSIVPDPEPKKELDPEFPY